MKHRRTIKYFIPVLALLFYVNSMGQGCAFSVSVNPTHIICNGASTGVAEAIPTPDGTYNYLWSNGSTNRSISNLIAETYFVKVTDYTGCEIIEFITITQPPKLATTASIAHPICFEQNSGSIDLHVSGGVKPYSYVWSNNIASASNPNLYSGQYAVTITDKNFCALEKSYTLIQPDRLSTTADVETVLGYGLSDGSIDISTSGGVHPYEYSWSSDSGFLASSEDIYNIPSATYTLSITDSKNCDYDTSVFVSQPPPLGFTHEITDVFCNAYTDGSIDINAFGGVPPYTYRWANSEIVLNDKTPMIEELAIGNYYLTITDFNGITLSDSFYVDEPTTIVANIETTDANCYDSLDGNAYLTVSGGMPPYSFLWSNGAQTQDIENVHAGDYDVEVVDQNGCFRRVETTIYQPDSIEINTSVQHISCKDHYNGKVFTDVMGGIPPYSYIWTTGDISESIENLEVGFYSVTVTDDHQCPMMVTEEVRIPVNGCIEIPIAFTPNGDNMNETWDIKNYYLYPEIEVLVFNREGYIVFEDTGYEEAWDGRYNGNDVAPGTYYYVVNLHNGDPVYKGIVTIIR